MNLESFVINANSFFAFRGLVENLLHSFCSDMFLADVLCTVYLAADTSVRSNVLCRYIETLPANTFDRYIVVQRVLNDL